MALKLIAIALLCIQFQLMPELGVAQGEGDAVHGGYWLADSGLQASDIDSSLFTHLFCAFAQLNPATNQLTLSPECSSFPQTVQKKNPSVITLLSIGGGSGDQSSALSSMASQPSSRKAFINSSITLARSNHYDGLDLDWEQQTNPSQMANLATLLDEWRAAANAESSATGADPLILTAAVGIYPQTRFAQTSYPTAAIARSLDWVNVMAYDFYDLTVSPVTRASAALFDPTGGVSGSKGVQAWIDAGVPREQLVLGFPFYGYAWKLADSENHGLLAPAAGVDSSIGDAQYGTVTYNAIKQQFIGPKAASVVYNSSYGTNYCYSGKTWIGYDDIQTISAKVTYAKTNGLFGYFAWHLAQDYNWALSKQASQAWGAQ